MGEFLIVLFLAGVGLLGIGAVLAWAVILAVRGMSVVHFSSKLARNAVRAFNGAAVVIVLGFFVGYANEKVEGPERLHIDIRYGNFYRHMVAGESDEAYLLTSPRYREANSVDDFAEEFSFVPHYNPFPGRYLTVSGNRATYYPGFDHWPMSGPIFEWVKLGEEWYIDGFTWSLD